MRFLCIAPDPVTGRMAPFRGEAGIAIELTARDLADARRLAAANRIPAAVELMTPDEYETLRNQKAGPSAEPRARGLARASTPQDRRFRSTPAYRRGRQ